MPIDLNRPIRRKARVIRLENNLGDSDNKELMVWWYCGIYKNPTANSQPHALVAFREITPEGLSDAVILRRLPLTTLGQVRIGSIWKNRRSQSEVVFESFKFNVVVHDESWRFVSFNDVWQKTIPNPPYPFEIYPLQFKGDKNWMIEFDLSSGGKLLIPCLEFFTRCYGRSAELKRILSTYPWCDPNTPVNSRLYAPLDESEESGKWKIKMRRRMVNGDIVFLANAKYNRYTESVAKHIYAQIETEHDPERKIPVFLKVAPWFQGDMQLKVSGISFDNGQSFLALQVNGCSNPGGALIIRDRENTNLTEGTDLSPSNAWSGMPERQIIKPPEIIDLTSNLEPDSGSGTVEIEDDDFEELGLPPVIIDRRREKSNSTTGMKSQSTSSDQYSSGEPAGTEKGVGYASIHAKPVLESKGTLRDVWTAMLYLHKKYPETIKKVQWFTWENSFSDESEPELIGLTEFESRDDVDMSTRKWLYSDTFTGEVRGILVARMALVDKWVCILEIQRRLRTKKDSNGEQMPSEESFKGLVCIPSSMSQFEDWLTHTLSEIRYKKGIVRHLEGKHIENCMSFAHSRFKNEQIAGEAAVLNALEKVGIQLSIDT